MEKARAVILDPNDPYVILQMWINTIQMLEAEKAGKRDDVLKALREQEKQIAANQKYMSKAQRTSSE